MVLVGWSIAETEFVSTCKCNDAFRWIHYGGFMHFW